MRGSLTAAAACLSLVACAATPRSAPSAQQPPGSAVLSPPASYGGWDGPLPPSGPAIEGDQARQLATELLSRLGGAISMIHEHRVPAGPGRSVSGGYTFYEYPMHADRAGLCTMSAHTVRTETDPVLHAPPGPPRAGSIHTSERFYMLGTSLHPAPLPANPPQCSDVPREHFFTAESVEQAQLAMEAFEWGLRWIREGNAGAIVVECVSFPGPCDGRRLLLERFTPQRVSSVRWVPCAVGEQPGCWAVSFRHEPGEQSGLWSALVRGPQRPMRIILREDPRPVS